MSIGASMATAAARLRQQAGMTFVWSGLTIHASEVLLNLSQANEVLAGIGLNAANADVRLWSATPTDFTGGAYPAEGDTVTVPQGNSNVTYRVVRTDEKRVGGVATAVIVTVYRNPADPSATVAQPGETGAGLVKPYAPPDTTYNT